jgi:hypothetical protein
MSAVSARLRPLGAILLVLLAGLNAPGAPAALAAACTAPWSIQTSPNPGTEKTVIQDVDASSPTNVWAVGSYLNGGGLRTLAQRYDGTSWKDVKAQNLNGGDNVLNDVAAIGTSNAWAVGWSKDATLIEHWDGTAWTALTSPNPGSRKNALAAIDASGPNDVWAVGFQQGTSGAHETLTLHYNGTAWSAVPSPNVPNASSTLAAVAVIGPNDVWAAGYSTSATGSRNLAMHWNGTTWTRVAIPNLGAGDSTITDLAAVSGSDIWAVGYTMTSDRYLTVAAHWDGTSWNVVSTPSPATVSVLRGVAAVGTGSVWAVGFVFDRSMNTYRSLTEHWNGTNWSVVPAAAAATENYLTGVTAVSSSKEAWAVGWFPPGGLVEYHCSGGALVGDGGHGADDPGGEAVPTSAAPAFPRPASSDGPTAALGRRDRAVPRTPAESVIAVDKAGPAGLAQVTQTYSGAVGDFNRDGWADFFESHHKDPSQLFQNVNGTFSEIDPGTFTGYPTDRHHCAWSDVNRDRLPDLFCVEGAERGTEVKRNELQIQQPDHTFVEETAAFGLLDLYARGRYVTFLDVNGDRFPDVFLSNDTVRADGIPGTNRLLLNVNGESFEAAPSYGLDQETSSGGCTQAADFDGDGWTDLLLCSGYGDGVHLYHNDDGTGFTDVSAAMHAPGGKVGDAVFGDVNGDGVQDLVSVTKSEAQVYLQEGGVLTKEFTFPGLTAAARVALADVNGDSRPDIYVLSGQSDTANPPDTLLINDGDGRSFTKMTIPETASGCGDDVFPIDYDHNGLSDFIVLNGCNDTPGPVQLIAFFPA